MNAFMLAWRVGAGALGMGLFVMAVGCGGSIERLGDLQLVLAEAGSASTTFDAGDTTAWFLRCDVTADAAGAAGFDFAMRSEVSTADATWQVTTAPDGTHAFDVSYSAETQKVVGDTSRPFILSEPAPRGTMLTVEMSGQQVGQLACEVWHVAIEG